MRLAGLFGVLENATKKQLYRFTGLNRCLATIATAVKIKPQVDGLPNIKMQGMVRLRRSYTVIRHSFENDPLGTEENGSFMSRGRAVRNRTPRIGLIYYV